MLRRERGNLGRTLSFGPKNLSFLSLGIKIIKRNIKRSQESGKERIGRYCLRDDDSGDEIIPNLPNRQTGVTVRAQSGLPSQESETVQWDSQNLIHASTQHLYGLMIGLDESDASQVMTACEVAKQIQSLMRLQLDAVKVRKGLNK